MTTQHLRVASPADLQVAIYARVSSDQQAERHTIDSQIAELKARALQDGYQVREDMLFGLPPAWLRFYTVGRAISG